MEPESTPEIQRAFDELGKRVAECRELVGCLRDKVTPTLTPVENEAKIGIAERSPCSKVASDIYEYADQLQIVCEKISDAIERCEL